jgi:hypothetical protein
MYIRDRLTLTSSFKKASHVATSSLKTAYEAILLTDYPPYVYTPYLATW